MTNVWIYEKTCINDINLISSNSNEKPWKVSFDNTFEIVKVLHVSIHSGSEINFARLLLNDNKNVSWKFFNKMRSGTFIVSVRGTPYVRKIKHTAEIENVMIIFFYLSLEYRHAWITIFFYFCEFACCVQFIFTYLTIKYT